jgi:hypothetical protein
LKVGIFIANGLHKDLNLEPRNYEGSYPKKTRKILSRYSAYLSACSVLYGEITHVATIQGAKEEAIA